MCHLYKFTLLTITILYKLFKESKKEEPKIAANKNAKRSHR